MTCPQCKTSGISETASFCATCGFGLRVPERVPEYASFWRRLGAYQIDTALLSLVVLPLILFLYPVQPGEQMEARRNPMSFSSHFGPDLATRTTGALGFIVLLVFVYHTAMNCSPWQGSVGKRLMKLRVVDNANRPLQLPRAALREACRMVSVMPLELGFLWIFWEPRRRAFHDMLAGTLVIYDQARGRTGSVPPPLPQGSPLPPIPVRVVRRQPPPIPGARP